MVPLVEGLGGVDALVALEPEQLAAGPAGQHLGHLGLADAGARPRAAAGAASGGRGRRPWPAPRRPGSRARPARRDLGRESPSDARHGMHRRHSVPSQGDVSRRLLQGPADEHLGQVGAVLDGGVEVGLRLGAVGRLLGRVGGRRARRPAPRPRRRRSSGVEPMLTRPTPVRAVARTAATPTMAQSWARRLNFWNDQPAPGTLGTRISVSSSSGSRADSRKPVKKSRRRDRPARRAAPRATSDAAERQHDRGQVRRRVGVGDRAADGAAVAHLRVADLAGRVGQERHLRPAAGREVSRSRWRVSAPMATWSPASRTYGEVVEPADVDRAPTACASRSFISGSSEWPPARSLASSPCSASSGERLVGRRRPGRSRTRRGS